MTAHDKSLNAIEKSITQPLAGQDGDTAAKPETAPARSTARDSVLDGEILGAAEAPAARRAGPDFVPSENGARAAAAGMPVDAPAPERADGGAEAEPATTADSDATASDTAVPFAVLADGPAAAPAAFDGGSMTSLALRDDMGAGGVFALPTDTLFSQQWHLVNGAAGELDLNIAAVWDSTGQNYTGQGVDVVVVDTGYDRSHHEFSDFDFGRDRDWLDNDFVAEAVNANENHGTAVMGIIGADRDGNGTVGVAYDATLIGYRIGFGGADFLPNIISSLNQMVTDNIEVMNMSIGLLADFVRNTNTNNMETAIANVIDNGRGGLGGIIVKSAGNGRNDIPDLNDDTNGEILASDRGTISVAAVDRDGTLTNYSTHGASNLISAFGSPSAGEVVTTDRRGSDGYNSGANPDYTFSFNGTSAAAPMVAGVVALMLEANSSLGWRDVQDILAYSARHVGTAIGSGTSGFEEYAWVFNGASDWNGGGLHFNSDYGFGLIDAHAAVRLAETWGTDSQTSANDATEFEDVLNTTVTITGFGTNSFTITPTSGLRVEHIEVDINFIDWYDLGDLEIELISPDGTSSLLIDNSGEDDGTSAGGYVVGGARRWEFFSNAFRGEDASGSWTLNIRDDDSSSVSPITINDIDITFYGAAASNDDRFIITEEFSTYAGTFGHGTSFAGGAGDDTLNAAAVSSDTLISLLANTGTIDGVAITNSNIEHVFTGDGDDTILGDGFGIHLSTGRGNDSVNGGSANESIEGGAGNDTLEGGTGNDTINGGTGADRIEGEAGDDILNGGAGNDSFVYRNGQAATFGEVVTGGTGNDRILLEGAGTYNFGAGSNMFDVVDIEEIEFAADGSNVDKTIILGNKELDSATEFLNVRIDGNANTGSDDTIIVNLDFSDSVNLSGWTFQDWNGGASFGNDQIFINGNANANNIVGTSQDDTIDGVGNGSDDTISAGGGDDLILYRGGGPASGDAGDDTVEFLSGAGGETVDGGTGQDTIESSNFSWASSVIWDLQAGTRTVGLFTGTWTNFEHHINTNAGDNSTVLGTSTGNLITTGGGENTIDGRGGDDTINAGAGEDTVDGGAGNDLINGGANDDTLRGGLGTDTVNGGSGNDLIIVDGGDGLDDANGGTGNDTLDYSGTGGAITFNMATGAFDFGGNARTATNFENFLSGSGNDSITGSAAANLIDGGGGNDTIRGEGGTDTVNGGAGNDLIIVDAGDGLDDADGGTGTDTLDYSGTGGNITFNMATGAFAYNGIARTATNFENFLGGSGNDSVTGTNGANMIDGGGGNDTLVGGSGIDTLMGGSGNDVFVNNGGEFIDDIFGDAGTDTLDMSGYNFNFLTADLTAQTYTVGGGAGVQTLASVENVIGMSSNDVINGSVANNVIDGGAGDDDILGQNGDDSLIGGLGNDTVGAGLGDDTVEGGAGGDRIFGAGGNDRLLGDDGNDFLHGGGDDDLLGGGIGDDTLDGAFGNDTLFGAGGDDDMDGGGNDDRLAGGGGSDTMQGGDGNDTLQGGAGNDTGFGGDGDDNVNGDTGNDFLRGGDGDDRVSGGSGFDTVFGDGGNDNVLGFGGNDFLRGGGGHDLVGGAFGNDLMFGDAGNDRLFGGDANDTMFGGTGNDRLFGQQGADLMAGNAGADTFVYQDVSDSFAGSRDTITDFVSGLDHMNLISIDADTTNVGNQAFTFIGGAGFSATAGELRFVTNGVDGFVLGDVDGDAASDFVVQLSGVAAMNAGDFFL